MQQSDNIIQRIVDVACLNGVNFSNQLPDKNAANCYFFFTSILRIVISNVSNLNVYE